MRKKESNIDFNQSLYWLDYSYLAFGDEIMTEKSDHDLLIALSTKLDMFMKQQSEHMEQDSREHAVFDKEISAAHKRLDQFYIGGIIVFVVAITSAIMNLWP